MKTGKLLSLDEVADRVAQLTGGPRPWFCTVFRWVTQGIAGVKLPAIALGRKLYVRPEDLEQFFADVAAAKIDRRRRLRPTPPARTPAQRRRASRQAAKELSRRGA